MPAPPLSRRRCDDDGVSRLPVTSHTIMPARGPRKMPARSSDNPTLALPRALLYFF